MLFILGVYSTYKNLLNEQQNYNEPMEKYSIINKYPIVDSHLFVKTKRGNKLIALFKKQTFIFL